MFKINEHQPKIKRKKKSDARKYEIMKLWKYLYILQENQYWLILMFFLKLRVLIPCLQLSTSSAKCDNRSKLSAKRAMTMQIFLK